MTPNTPRRPPVTGPQVLAALVAILCATVVLPPAAAWTLNRFRVNQTDERVRVALTRLQEADGQAARLAASNGVVCGPGRLPGQSSAMKSGLSRDAHIAWLGEVRRAPELFGSGMPTDAWGRCFVINAGDWQSGGPVWLLSAGPNGLLETRPGASALAGDDIGGRLR